MTKRTALNEDKVQWCQDLDVLLVQFTICLVYHSPLHCFLQDSVNYDINRGLHGYLLPVGDAVAERTVAFLFASSIQKIINGERQRPFASSIILYLDCCLPPLIAVSSSGSTTANPVGTVGPSSLGLVRYLVKLFASQ